MNILIKFKFIVKKLKILKYFYIFLKKGTRINKALIFNTNYLRKNNILITFNFDTCLNIMYYITGCYHIGINQKEKFD